MTVDIGWRLANGQQPFRDFYMTLPPVFAFGAQLAFALFGVAWLSRGIAEGAVEKSAPKRER